MRLLLDTHVALWFVNGDDRLGSPARNLIAEAVNEKWVSIASLWEVAIKNNFGSRVRDPIGFSASDLAAEFSAQYFDVLPISMKHLRIIERLPHHHRDPFDRMIVAQAQVEGLTLLTHDDQLAAYDAQIVLV